MRKKIIRRGRVRGDRGFYGGIWAYLKESRNYIYLVIALFFAFSVIGYLFNEQFSFLDEFLRGLIERVEGLNAIELIFFIFQNNLQSAFFGFVLGIFLGIMPVISAISNGVVLGYVFAQASAEEGFSVILSLLPHGIFELPAVFIALGLGLKLGMFIFAKKKKEEFRKRFIMGIQVFLGIIVPLLIIAAIIEGLLIAWAG